jgi:hypothetical protein
MSAIAADVAELERLTPEGREVAVTSMLDQARQWLDRAVASTAPAQDVAEFKAFVATVAEAAKQKKLSEGIQLDAVEMVRRSERALGVAIRQGQEAGEIGGRHDGTATAHREAHRGVANITVPPSPSEFAPKHELAATNGGIYDITDGVTDEQFEAALSEAREEGNLSRANVVRKVTKLSTFKEEQDAKWDRVELLANSGYTSAQIAREVGLTEQGIRKGAKTRGIEFPADRIVGRTRRINPVEVLDRIVASLEADESALALVNYDDITPEQATEWLGRIASPLREVRKMQNRLKEISE